MEKPQRIKELLDRLSGNRISKEELEQFFNEIALDEKEETIRRVIAQYLEEQSMQNDEDLPHFQHLTTKVKQQLAVSITHSRQTAFRRLPMGRWAAVLLLLLLTGAILFYYLKQERINVHPAAIAQQEPVGQPGGSHAFLKFDDGRLLNLDSVAIGAQLPDRRAAKSNGGTLSYLEEENLTAAYHTMVIPRGGQYQLVLADGTKVWLNAASSLRYPASFTKEQERKVYLTGEAYFEVAQNSVAPFIVETTQQQIRVLGTRFNVNSYADEPEQVTSLLSGKIKIEQGGKAVVLSPGQQFRIKGDEGKGYVLALEEPQQAIAWKAGVFQFEEADMASVMRQIGRWYNVDIHYEGSVPQGHFSGKIPRDAPMEDALKILQISGMQFKIEGRNIIIKP